MSEIFKDYIKTKVILKIFLLYSPFIFLITWFNWFIVVKLIGITTFFNPFGYLWYQIVGYFLIQYVYVSLMAGLIIGLYRVIKKNKDFFLS